MASNLVLAIWEGPFPGELTGNRTLQPGDEHLVTDEDLKSTHWRAVKAPKPKRSEKPGGDS